MNSISGSSDPSSIFEGSLGMEDELLDMLDGLEDEIVATTTDIVSVDLNDCKSLIAYHDAFNEPQVADFMSYVEQNKAELGGNPSEIMEKVKEKIANGDAHIALMHKKPGEEKPQFYFDKKFNEQAKDKDLHVRVRNRETGRTESTVLRPDDYVVKIFTDEQYARITNAAMTSLSSLADAYRRHQEKLAAAEEKGESLLKGRVEIRDDIPTQFVKDAMKNLTQQNQSYQRKRDQRLAEIKQEELDREERTVKERTIAHLDKKSEVRKEMQQRDDRLKSEEKGVA